MRGGAGTRRGGAPLIVRLGGVPVATVERFRTDLIADLETLRRLEARLEVARAELVDQLYEAIHGAPAATRRALLKVKRDCFNGRPVKQYLGTETWRLTLAVAAPQATLLAELEDDLATRRRELETSFDSALGEQHAQVAELLEASGFRCGLAVASPVVAENSRRLRNKSIEEYGRRERRLAPTLLRYISRAAVKLSPFSTFTAVAVGEVVDDAEVASVRLVGDGWSMKSLVRLKRYLLDQYAEMLRRYPPLRGRLVVSMNDSAIEIAAGRYLYLRPSYWRSGEDGRKLRFHEESLVKVGLGGALVESVRRELATGRPSYRDLIAALAEGLAGDLDRERIAGELDRLLDIGYLHLELPWAGDEEHLEKRMLERLRSLALPHDEALDGFLGRLERLVELEEGLLRSAQPHRALAEIRELIGELWRAAAPLGGLGPEVEHGQVSDFNVYQDTLYEPSPGTSSPVLISRPAVRRALRSVSPLVRLTQLFDHRHEGLLTLGAFAARQWPGRSRVPLLEAFQAFRPLWQDFVKFQVDIRKGDCWRETWNPLELEAAAELARHRDQVWAEIGSCLRNTEEGQRISAEALDALLDRTPARYTSSPLGPCLFLQPVAADGSLWMLNRIKEGSGRFGSRFTPVMDPETRRLYVGHLAARGGVDHDGEPCELLDLQAIHGDTLNVHTPQTPKVLTLPGASTTLPDDRRRRLGDLYLSQPAGGWPALCDAGGKRYLTVFLGVGHYDYMPTLTKFLCLFGPSEMAAVFPPAHERQQGDVRVRYRTVIGNVAIGRKSWFCRSEPLRSVAAQLGDLAFFEAVQRWRLEHGIPEIVFMVERVPHPHNGERYQPQYIDFSSPLFTSIFRSALDSQSESLTFVEPLPCPDTFPADGAGRRWAVEVLVDSLALRAASAENDRKRLNVHPFPAVVAGKIVQPTGSTGTHKEEMAL